eukprot:1341805-Amorphochlora_amoeboformis.AAC.2
MKPHCVHTVCPCAGSISKASLPHSWQYWAAMAPRNTLRFDHGPTPLTRQFSRKIRQVAGINMDKQGFFRRQSETYWRPSHVSLAGGMAAVRRSLLIISALCAILGLLWPQIEEYLKDKTACPIFKDGK